jgi:hypothetical protein
MVDFGYTFEFCCKEISYTDFALMPTMYSCTIFEDVVNFGYKFYSFLWDEISYTEFASKPSYQSIQSIYPLMLLYSVRQIMALLYKSLLVALRSTSSSTSLPIRIFSYSSINSVFDSGSSFSLVAFA